MLPEVFLPMLVITITVLPAKRRHRNLQPASHTFDSQKRRLSIMTTAWEQLLA